MTSYNSDLISLADTAMRCALEEWELMAELLRRGISFEIVDGRECISGNALIGLGGIYRAAAVQGLAELNAPKFLG